MEDVKKAIDFSSKPFTFNGWLFPLFLMGSFGLTYMANPAAGIPDLLGGWFSVAQPENVIAGVSNSFNAVAPWFQDTAMPFALDGLETLTAGF